MMAPTGRVSEVKQICPLTRLLTSSCFGRARGGRGRTTRHWGGVWYRGKRGGEGPSYLHSSRNSQGLALEDGFAHRVTKGLVFVTVHQVPVHLA